ncbi:MAG: hypothetical protein IJ219_11200 [Bacteroidaceae bacterium]|nr:hypothetical protein [Bacteroidaceae bacterium]
MNDDNFFRQALQRQNDRAAGMKMPDDMEQRVMKSLKAQTTKRRWLYPLSSFAIAACALLLIMLNTGKQQPKQLPVITEVVTVPKDNIKETPHAIVPTETIEQPIVAQAEKPQPTKKRRKVHKPILEEPVPQEAEPAQVEPEQENEYLPQQPDLYLMAIADAQDIRSRGERLYQEVAQLMNNH